MAINTAKTKFLTGILTKLWHFKALKPILGKQVWGGELSYMISRDMPRYLGTFLAILLYGDGLVFEAPMVWGGVPLSRLVS